MTDQVSFGSRGLGQVECHHCGLKTETLGFDLACGEGFFTRKLKTLGADTVVVSARGELLGKPEDASDARRILRSLSATTHRVITGVAVVIGETERVSSETTRVTMGRMSAAEIDAYIASGECFGKAGAYAIQETGDRFVTHIDGSWSNVVGLPLALTTRLLAEVGIRVGEATE